MARPRIQIDKEQFEKLCAIQCTLGEIASWFHCSQDTIQRWAQRTYSIGFADAYKIYSAQGKISLRRFQFKQAEKSTSMAIWLGKQWLGQKDHVEMGVTSNSNEVNELDEYFTQRNKTGDT